MDKPLNGRIALVTGVSRHIGIGYAIVNRLLDDGASVFATGWSPHDEEMPWGTNSFDHDDFTGASTDADTETDASGRQERFAHVEADLADPATPVALIDATIERFGAVDIIVANHARSSHDSLADVTVDELDACWQINARASLLLAQAFDRLHDGGRPGGRMVMFTSGQHLAPMDGEIAYAVSKGAIHQMTKSLANALADKAITVNTINPGPVDTGYATGDIHRDVADRFPAGRWGQPDDAARLVAWLVSDEAAWITGEVINSEGGWRR